MIYVIRYTYPNKDVEEPIYLHLFIVVDNITFYTTHQVHSHEEHS